MEDLQTQINRLKKEVEDIKQTQAKISANIKELIGSVERLHNLRNTSNILASEYDD